MIKITLMKIQQLRMVYVCTFHNALCAHCQRKASIYSHLHSSVLFETVPNIFMLNFEFFIQKRCIHFVRTVCVCLPVCMPHSCNFASFASIFMFSCSDLNLHTFRERVQFTVVALSVCMMRYRKRKNKQASE